MLCEDVDEVIAQVLDIAALVVVVEAPRVGLVEHLLQRDVRHRRRELEQSLPATPHLLDHVVELALLAEADHDRAVAGCQVVLLRDEGRRWRVERRDDDVDLVRQRREDLSRATQHVAALVEGPEQHREVHHRADRVQRELELGDNAEVAATAAQRPEQVGVGGRVGAQDLPVSGDHLRRGHVVDAQAVLAGEPPHAAAEREAADAGVADRADRVGEPVLLGRLDDVTEQSPTSGAGAPRVGVDRDCVELAQVDDQTVVDGRLARDAVCSTAYGDLEVVAHGEPDRRRDIGGGLALREDGVMPVDRRVPQTACVVVLRITADDHSSGHRAAQSRRIDRHGAPQRPVDPASVVRPPWRVKRNAEIGDTVVVTPEELADLAHLRRARDLMDRDYAKPLDVPAMARAALMSPAHFSRQFRAAYGETPYSYLMTRRIERAKALLRRGDMSVTDVCVAVGCTSLGSFSTRFTELVGESPSSYRSRDHSSTAQVPGCITAQRSRPSRIREAKPLSGT